MIDLNFQNLQDLFQYDPDVQPGMMFGSHCLKIRGKVFLTSSSGQTVFKLPPDAHARALALPGAERFNPSGRRELREWVSVPAEHAPHFPELAQAAAQFVGGA